MKNLDKKYNKIVNKYCKIFAKKHEIDFDGWVADRVGEIANFGDYFFDFREIKFCIDNDISFDYLSDWYFFCVEFQKIADYNFENYCKLRQDFEYKKGFGFVLLEFEKYLLKLKLESSYDRI